MIIEKERFEQLTEEEIKNLCSKYNKEVENKFYIEGNKFCFDNIKIPLQNFSYKDLSRTCFMTDEEFGIEVRAGRIEGINMNERGQIIF